MSSDGGGGGQRLVLTNVWVHLGGAFELIGMVLGGRSSNPQARVTLEPGGTEVFRTGTAKSTLNPEWGEEASFALDSPVVWAEDARLRVAVFHVDSWGSDDLCIGAHDIDLSSPEHALNTRFDAQTLKLLPRPEVEHRDEDRALDRRGRGFGYVQCSWEVAAEWQAAGEGPLQRQPSVSVAEGSSDEGVADLQQLQQQGGEVEGEVDMAVLQNVESELETCASGGGVELLHHSDGREVTQTMPQSGGDGGSDASSPSVREDPHQEQAGVVAVADPTEAGLLQPTHGITEVIDALYDAGTGEEASQRPQAVDSLPASPLSAGGGGGADVAVAVDVLRIEAAFRTRVACTPLLRLACGAGGVGEELPASEAADSRMGFVWQALPAAAARVRGRDGFPVLVRFEVLDGSSRALLEEFEVPVAAGTVVTKAYGLHGVSVNVTTRAAPVASEPPPLPPPPPADESVVTIVRVCVCATTSLRKLSLPLLRVGELRLPPSATTESSFTWDHPVPPACLGAADFPYVFSFDICDGITVCGPFRVPIERAETAMPVVTKDYGIRGVIVEVTAQTAPKNLLITAVSDDLLRELDDDADADADVVADAAAAAAPAAALCAVAASAVELALQAEAGALVLAQERAAEEARLAETDVPALVDTILNADVGAAAAGPPQKNKWLVAPYEYHFPGQQPVAYPTQLVPSDPEDPQSPPRRAKKPVLVRYMVRPPSHMDYNSPLYTNILGTVRAHRLSARARDEVPTKSAAVATDLTMGDVQELVEYRELFDDEHNDEYADIGANYESAGEGDAEPSQPASPDVTGRECVAREVPSGAEADDAVMAEAAGGAGAGAELSMAPEDVTRAGSVSECSRSYVGTEGAASRRARSMRSVQHTSETLLTCPSPGCGMENMAEFRTRRRNVVKHVRYCGNCGCHLQTEIPDGVMDELRRSNRRILEYEQEMGSMELKIATLQRMLQHAGRGKAEAEFAAANRTTTAAEHAAALQRARGGAVPVSACVSGPAGASKLDAARDQKRREAAEKKRAALDLQQHAAQMARIRQKLYDNEPELFLAAARGAPGLFTKLKKVDPEMLQLRGVVDSAGRTPLNVAAQHGHYGIVSTILREVPCRCRDEHMRLEDSLMTLCLPTSLGNASVLHSAALSGKVQLVEFLANRLGKNPRFAYLLMCKTSHGHTAADLGGLYHFALIHRFLENLAVRRKAKVLKMRGNGNQQAADGDAAKRAPGPVQPLAASTLTEGAAVTAASADGSSAAFDTASTLRTSASVGDAASTAAEEDVPV